MNEARHSGVTADPSPPDTQALPSGTGEAAAEPSEWRRGWPVVLAATVGFSGTLALLSTSAGLFIAPMRAETGWPMSLVAFVPIVTLIISAMMPIGGWAIDRFGGRRVAIFGLLLFAAAELAMALLPLSVVTLYVLVACLGLLGPAGNSGPYVRVVATWFRKNTGSAFGILLSGTSLSGVLCLPLIGAMIERYGWRAGYLTMAAIILCVILPVVVWLFRENPEIAAKSAKGTPETLEGKTLRETFADPRFWLLMLSLGLAALPMGTYLAHLQPMLRAQHFDIRTAAALGSVFLLAIGVGRIGGGILIDRLWDYGVATVLLTIAAIGCFMTTSLDPQGAFWTAGVIVFAIGLTYGAEVDFGAYFTLKLFGLREFSKIFGIKSLVVGGGVASGGILTSALFDVTGGYGVVAVGTGLMFLASAAIMLVLGLDDRARKRAKRDRTPDADLPAAEPSNSAVA